MKEELKQVQEIFENAKIKCVQYKNYDIFEQYIEIDDYYICIYKQYSKYKIQINEVNFPRSGDGNEDFNKILAVLKAIKEIEQ